LVLIIWGHLAGGFEAWEKAGKETDAVHRITADAFADAVKIGEIESMFVKKVNMQRNTLMNRIRPLANIND
jgi:hypothetical protein